MRHSLYLALLFTISMVGCKSSEISQTTKVLDGIQFSKGENFETVLALAKSEGKLVFVDFYADWCTPCKMMDQEVFTDKSIGDYFNKKFVNIKVDSEKGNGPDLAAIFEVTALPTLLFLDEIGRVVMRREGAAFHTDLRNMAENALSQKESMSYIDMPQN